jgi:hypothetical protein
LQDRKNQLRTVFAEHQLSVNTTARRWASIRLATSAALLPETIERALMLHEAVSAVGVVGVPPMTATSKLDRPALQRLFAAIQTASA